VPLDDDWLVVAVSDEAVTIEHTQTKSIAVVGLDGIYSYFTDPARSTPTERCGFLQLHVQVDIAADGSVSVTPLPPPRAIGSVAVVDPLEAETARLAAQQYRSLWLAARATIRHLLTAGDATEQQVFTALAPIGYSDGERNVLARIASATQLVQRVQRDDTRETRLVGYTGPYTINPTFTAALKRLVANDQELR
jgi:hypothetical protein